ncbi:MAG: DUF5606 domain-containing protein [Bacteroidales bacterium]|jgi:hypothetical protein|nr:DUF5606 domain-containing protein [Bacteroidales bacterium]
MALKDILVISGQSGIFRFVSRGRTTVIVENIVDGKRSNVAATAQLSMLEDIAVFTEKDEVPLHKIFKRIQAKENGGSAIHHKSPDAELRQYFETILPDYDKERVYLSDIRKMLMWYNALIALGITSFDKEEDKEETATDSKP